MTAFIRFGGRLRARVRRFGRDQSGTTTLSFLLMFPLVFGIFLTTLDSGFATMRSALLDRALDVSARQIRNGTMASTTIGDIRTEMCKELTAFKDCSTMLKLQFVSVPRADFTMPPRSLACDNSGTVITPVTSFTAGQANPITVLRACMVITSFTPSALMSARPGTYQIEAATVIAGSMS